jgi:hypothetical protein
MRFSLNADYYLESRPCALEVVHAATDPTMRSNGRSGYRVDYGEVQQLRPDSSLLDLRSAVLVFVRRWLILLLPSRPCTQVVTHAATDLILATVGRLPVYYGKGSNKALPS